MYELMRFLCLIIFVFTHTNTHQRYEAVIVEGPDGDGNFLVHFKGWQPRFDERIPSAAHDRIQPQWTKLGDWRSQVRRPSL